jgi:myxalamid-type polyketide synthase MxaD
MLSSLGALFVLGAKPDWDAYDQRYRRRRVALPTYPFQRERHWLPVASADSGRQVRWANGHSLLGMHVSLAGRPGEHIWCGEIGLERCPWIKDHRVQGRTVLPAAAYIEMAIAAAVEAVSDLPVVLTQFEIKKELLLQRETEFEIQTRLENQVAGNMIFQVHSRRRNSKGDWTLNASGTIQGDKIEVPAAKFDAFQREALENRSVHCLDGAEFYRLHEERGNQWGPCFQGLSRVWQGHGEALSAVTVPLAIQGELSCYLFHPAFFDSLTHTLTATIPLEKTDDRPRGLLVSAGIEEFRVYRRPEGTHFYAHAQLRNGKATPDHALVGDIKLFDVSGNLVSEAVGMRLVYLDADQKRGALESLDDCLYEPQWELKELASASSTPIPMRGTWIIFRDQQGVGDAACVQLMARGAACLCVDRGEERSQANDGWMTIRPDNADDYDELLRAAARQNSVVTGIVHLWSLDAADPEKADLKAVHQAQTLGPVSVLRVVQALNRTRLKAPPKLWLVSRGAQPVGEKLAPLSALQSPLWGLGRTIAMESADFWGGMVDLDPANVPTAAAALLLSQLAEQSGEDQTAFRGGRRHVARLNRRAKILLKPERVPVRSDATYLITGGLGGIGLIIAHWLVIRGARHLILAGRTSLPDRKEWQGFQSRTIEGARISAIRELESLGANVQTVSVDMGSDLSVTEMISRCLRADQRPLRGVFHAAGVTQDELLINQSAEQMRDILAAKMVGGWLLHRLLADIPLDLFVLFSSFSSFLGPPMLGSYSAANVFLDALAYHRRSLGQVGLSINWGPWAEAGMAARLLTDEESNGNRLKGIHNGARVLSTQLALEAMERLLEQGAIQTGVMSIDWKTWHRWTYGGLAISPYLSLLVSNSRVAGNTVTADSPRERILGARLEQRSEMVDSYLAGEMALILKVPLSLVDREKPIVNMGFDSLMSIELKNRIETHLGVSVAMSRLIQSPTILELTDFVLNLLVDSRGVDPTVGVGSSMSEFEEGVL